MKDGARKVQDGLRQLARLFQEIQEALGGSTCGIGSKQDKKAGCWRAGTLVKAGNGALRTIAEVRLGHRVATLSSGERGGTVASDVRVEASRWRAVSLVQEDAAHGGVLTMALLRPQEWLSEHGVEVGSSVSLDLPEMGVQGKALVTALEREKEVGTG